MRLVTELYGAGLERILAVAGPDARRRAGRRRAGGQPAARARPPSRRPARRGSRAPSSRCGRSCATTTATSSCSTSTRTPAPCTCGCSAAATGARRRRSRCSSPSSGPSARRRPRSASSTWRPTIPVVGARRRRRPAGGVPVALGRKPAYDHCPSRGRRGGRMTDAPATGAARRRSARIRRGARRRRRPGGRALRPVRRADRRRARPPRRPREPLAALRLPGLLPAVRRRRHPRCGPCPTATCRSPTCSCRRRSGTRSRSR